MNALRIVGIGGSVAPASKSRSALEAALDGAAGAGADTRLLDLHHLELPMFNPTLLADPPASATELVDAAYGADGLLWSSPMYHGTISGAFKNALDWLYLVGDRNRPYLADKVIDLISTAGGTQGLQAVNTIEFIVHSLCGWAIPLVVPVGPAQRLFATEGTPPDEAARPQLMMLGAEVARIARLFKAGTLAEAQVECEAAACLAVAA